ncbi:DUF4298 domain-containing protein [Flavobacterium sp. P4023]|uniref:DUF4298 domain-containing protein n=1 Tax=Flavobacterium flabelliforme TaxID=2816119 RepID=A0ABS5CV75_9FLAO|nr:DUF4298 domain-containing protein [Flavobacterium flabelliforme]MBP4142529.1 DUF4298 domain-containing protein [Flavobacterium flabelliforme]
MSELTDRITKMENILDELTLLVEISNKALNDLEGSVEKLKELKVYYEKQYMLDFQADERGEIPKDLKRGVLSEDLVHILLTDLFELSHKMKKLSKVIR